MKYVGSIIQGVSGAELRGVIESLLGERVGANSDMEAHKQCIDGAGSSAKVHMLRRFYVWDDEGQVDAFLEQCPFLIDVLIEAIPYVVHIFGPDVECMLAALEGAEEPQSGVLFVGIHIDNAEGMCCKLKEALGLFKDQMGKSRAKLCIDLVAEEVVAPGISMGKVLRVVPDSWL